MSFLSKFRGSQDKAKNKTKKEWEPPKIPPPEDTNSRKDDAKYEGTAVKVPSKELGPNASQSVTTMETRESQSSFDFMMNDHGHNEDLTTKQGDNSASFLIKESNASLLDEEITTDVSQNASPFSFLSVAENTANQVSDTQMDSTLEDSVIDRGIDKVTTINTTPKPVVKKKVEVTPRKKKKKAVQPGYGKNTEDALPDLHERVRSLSTSSTADTRSEGSVESDMREVITDEVKTDTSHRRQSTSSQSNSSAFGFVSDEPMTDSPKNIQTKQIDNSENLARITQPEMITNSDHVLETQNFATNEANIAADLSVGNSKVDHEELESVRREILNREVPEQGVMDHECDGVIANSEDDKAAKNTEVDNQEIDTSIDLQMDDSNLGSKQTTENIGTKEADITVSIHDETLRDLKVILDQGGASPSNDVSYELKLNEEEKIEIYLETLKSRETALREQFWSLNEKGNQLLADFRDVTYSKGHLLSKLKQLQEDQNIAISKEDFASAESINHEIEKTNSKLERLKFMHPIFDEKVSEFLEEWNKCLNDNQHECSDLRNEFQEIIKSEEHSLNEHISKTDTNIYRSKLKLNEEKAKLDREMSHIALDKEHLDKNKVKLDHEVYERTRSHETEKDGLVKERDIVRSEINELEHKLASLRKKEEKIYCKIEKVDSKILEITKDFLPQQETLEKEQKDISEKENEIFSKLENLEKTETELEAKQEKEENFEKRCTANIEILTTKISSLHEFKNVMDANLINFEDIIEMDLINLSVDDNHKSLLKTKESLSDELHAANCKDLECNTQIARLKKKLDDIEARVEELEKEKQIAIKGKNFQAAKVVTKERNKLLDEGQKSQEELKKLEDEKHEIENSMIDLTKEMSCIKEKIEIIENELDKKISTSLTTAIASFQNYLKKTKQKSWIRPFLKFEIQICKDIIRDIHSKHKWNEPEIEGDDDESSEEVVDTDEVSIVSQAEVKELSNATNRNCENETERISDDDEANNAKEDRLSIEAIETKIEELEEQLQLAVENEDFDQADELNTNIEDLKKLQEAS